MGQFFLVQVRFVVLKDEERGCLRVCDRCTMRIAIPSFRYIVIILWLRCLDRYGIFRYDLFWRIDDLFGASGDVLSLRYYFQVSHLNEGFPLA